VKATSCICFPEQSLAWQYPVATAPGSDLRATRANSIFAKPCRNLCIHCQVGYELADFRFRHFSGMLLVVKEDKAPDPANVSAFGAEAKMSNPGNRSDLVE
jgi:hypothetical protein